MADPPSPTTVPDTGQLTENLSKVSLRPEHTESPRLPSRSRATSSINQDHSTKTYSMVPFDANHIPSRAHTIAPSTSEYSPSDILWMSARPPHIETNVTPTFLAEAQERAQATIDGNPDLTPRTESLTGWHGIREANAWISLAVEEVSHALSRLARAAKDERQVEHEMTGSFRDTETIYSELLARLIRDGEVQFDCELLHPTSLVNGDGKESR